MPRWNPSDYAAHSSAQESWARELMEKLALEGHEHVLDIGSGDGRITAGIARRIPEGRVVGADSSEEMVLHARESFPAEEYPNLAFVLADARKLTFDGEFDVVFSNACLHWIADHHPVLAGISRSLRPGGRILLQMGGRGNAAGVVTAAASLIREPEWCGWFGGFPFPYGFHGPEEYRGWLVEAGFEAADASLFPKDMVHDGPEGLAGWVRTTWLPYIERVPDAMRERFIGEIVRRYLDANPPDSEGKTHVGMMRLEVKAKKKD